MNTIDLGQLINVLSIVKKYSGLGAMANLTLTCQDFYEHRREILDVGETILSGIKLRYNQNLLRYFFKETQGFTYFRGALSMGKTIAGYSCYTEASLILCTSNVLTPWVNDAEKLGWYHSDPKKSKIIINDSTRPKHVAFIKEYALSKATPPNKIIITTTGNKKLKYKVLAAMNVIKAMDCKEKVLVVDEAHLFSIGILSYLKDRTRVSGKPDLQGYAVFDRALMLSATPVPNDTKYLMNHIISAGLGSKDKVPLVKWRFYRVDQEENPDVNGLIKSLVKKHHKTTIISIKDTLTNLVEAKLFGDTNVITLKKGLATVNKFNTLKEDAVLLINTGQNEGINLHCDSLILLDLHVNSHSLNQTFGRVLRTGNKNKYVHIHMISNSAHIFYNYCYARCFSVKDKPHVVDINPDLRMTIKAAALIRVLGKEPASIDKVDGCILFSNPVLYQTTTEKAKIYQWWLKYRNQKTCLSLETIQTVLDYYPEDLALGQ